MASDSFHSLEPLIQQIIQEQVITAETATQLHQLISQRSLSPRERKLLAMVQDAIANRYIHVVSL